MDFCEEDFLPIQTTPFLKIIEEPRSEFRFRYQTEVRAAHGCLHGINSVSNLKSYPTVQLCNFNGAAIIRSTLCQVNSLNKSLHPHKLIVRRDRIFHSDPHIIEVSSVIGYQAVFKGLSIMHTPRKDILDKLIDKKITIRSFERDCELSDNEIDMIKRETEFEYKDIDLNRVCLCFEAFLKNNGKGYIRLCDPIYSIVINNLKSSYTGELRITRLSKPSCEAQGGELIFILVEKVSSRNIRVRFFEKNDQDDVVWEDWGTFQPADVHKQYAITFTTPPYRHQDINLSVNVFIQLHRPSDDAVSEPRSFMFVPNIKSGLNQSTEINAVVVRRLIGRRSKLIKTKK